MFSVRAVIIDNYISKSFSELYEKSNFDGTKHWLEPVIRIFGSTPDGVKSCVHVHGVYPYIYVPYIGGENPDRDALVLYAALDETLKITFNQSKTKFVYKVTVVSGIPFYGYHASHHQFFKIFLYNPYYIKKASDLLLRGAILGQKLQPHESHIPYTLQFMMDYNIYGMSFVNFSKVKYRRNPEKPDSLNGIDQNLVLSEKITKNTCSYLELDAFASDIINAINERGFQSNPGLKAILENEKNRRRAQNKPSQFTVEETPSRKNDIVFATEAMYRERLSAKLKEIKKISSLEKSDESKFAYPAQVSESSNLLEASVLNDGIHQTPEDLNNLLDLSVLIDEKIVSQIITDSKEKSEKEENEEDINGIEADSVLGKIQIEGEEEEPEYDDSGDMTQPLDLQEDEICGSNIREERLNTCDQEEFWQSMADKILQIDGAQDSSSDSDVEPPYKTSATNCNLDNTNTVQNNQSISNEPLINIISTLSESTLAPQIDSTNTVVPQCSAFWSNISPRIDYTWLPQNQDSWTWDKNDTGILDCFPTKSQTIGMCDFPIAVLNKPFELISTNEPLENLFVSNQLENYNSVSTSPSSNLESNYSDSSTATLTPCSRINSHSDINISSLSEPTNEKGKALSDFEDEQNNSIQEEVKSSAVSVSENKLKIEKRVKNVKQKNTRACEKVLKKLTFEVSQGRPITLTLKEYLKDLGDVVNVDLKNFYDQEMVVIEYMPHNSKTTQNKFLIKPLDKFLESWNVAEKKINGEITEENKPSCPKTNKINSTKLESKCETNKTNCERANNKNDNDSGGGDDDNNKCHEICNSKSGMQTSNFSEKVSKSVSFVRHSDVSKGKLKKNNCVSAAKMGMKVKKSEIKKNSIISPENKCDESENCLNLNNVLPKRCKNSKKNKINELNNKVYEKHLKVVENKRKDDQLNFRVDPRKEQNNQKNKREMEFQKKFLKKKLDFESFRYDNCDTESKNKLINQINSCFEDYFQNIVKVNNTCGKNRNNNNNNIFRCEKISGSSIHDSSSSDFETNSQLSNTSEDDCLNPKESFDYSNAKSVDFVARLLSTVTKMSKTQEIPPVSITINIGGVDNYRSEPLPVHLNIKSPNETQKKDHQKNKPNKRIKRKYKIQNVDGPADSSSSEDPEENFLPSCKKVKRESYYKALNVIQKSVSKEKTRVGRKRKSSKDKKMEHNHEGITGRKDSLDVCSRNKLRVEREIRVEPSSSKKIYKKLDFDVNKDIVDDLTSNKLLKVESNGKHEVQPIEEPDIIYDSDHEIVKTSLKKKKRKSVKNKFRKSCFDENLNDGNKIENEFNDQLIDNFFENIFYAEDERKSERNKESPEADINCVVQSKNDESNSDKVELAQQENFNESAKSEMESLSGQTSVEMPLSGSPLFGPNVCSLSSVEEDKNSKPEKKNFEQFFTHDINLPSTSKNLYFPHEENKCAKSNFSESSNSSILTEKNFLYQHKFIDEWNENSKESCVEEYLLPAHSETSSEKVEDFKDSTPIPVISLIQSKIIMPKKKPPSWNQIQSYLITVENLKFVTEVPHWSDARDLTKAMECGPVVLKVETNALAGLKTYKSSLDIMGTEERRAKYFKVQGGKKENYRSLLVSDRDIVITPLQKPPFSSAVLKTYNVDLVKKKKTEKLEAGKIKILMPLSPGQDSQSEEELDVTITPSTIKDSQPLTSLSNESPSSANGNAKKSLSGDCFETIPGVAPISEMKNPDRLPTITENQSLISDLKTSNKDFFLKKPQQALENSFQIRGITLENTFGFDNSVENLQDVKLNSTHQYLTMLFVEVHIQTRKNLRPDPDYDPIRALFYTVSFDSPVKDQETGIIVVNDITLSKSAVGAHNTHYVSTEQDLLLKLIELVKIWDPDIIAGYEIEMHSWGYIVQRGYICEINFFTLLSRVENNGSSNANKVQEEEFEDIPRCIRDLKICGRIVLDIWRLLRHEVTLTSYTFENVMYHLAHERHPHLSYETLSYYWEHPSHRFRHITFNYYVTRVTGINKILKQLDFVNRTSEFARLFGIQFYEVLSRGSQFRVESMMLRLAKPLNYIPVSPSVAQRASMRAPASLPLILEPESVFYSDPLIVLDFQSLYPSMIIAYNYCFSTCLGRVEKLGEREPFEFGCTQLQVSPEELKSLENDISISPAGVAFVKANIRKGILPTMLQEILETRLIVKKSLKENKGNRILQKVLHAQQLGLKLIANVTYGYTAANFSGRMPSIEVGDSVVSKGRETLHRAIQMVKNNQKWNAKVVYGDTDSIFVLTPGRSREEAFKIGAEIAEAVTRDNPKPVKLKLEKIYQPSILQTKKRYVGYMYESPDQEKPVFEAKGIETVRRDGCPAVGKILQKALQILFDTRDVSLVKKYTIRQFSKLFQGRSNIQDLIFAKEYRGRHGYRPGACVPALQLAKQWTRLDKRAEPRVKERVPYVIVNGPPGVPLIKLVRSPKDLISDPSLRINSVYYITKAIIPPLHRCLSLTGVDVAVWYAEMPKKIIKEFKSNVFEDQKKNTISQYFPAIECILCSEITSTPVCQKCQKNSQKTTVGIIKKIGCWEKSYGDIIKVCQSCCSNVTEFNCQSLDCPILFRRIQTFKDLLGAPHLYDILKNQMYNF